MKTPKTIIAILWTVWNFRCFGFDLVEPTNQIKIRYLRNSTNFKTNQKKELQFTSTTNYIFHEIKKNENLYELAKTYLNQTDFLSTQHFIAEISKLNKIEESKIVKGQQLLIPIKNDYKDTRLDLSNHKTPKGLYLSAPYSCTTNGIQLITLFKKAGGNTVIFDVKDISGDVHMKFSSPLADSIGASTLTRIPDLEKYISFLHQNDLKATARIACFADELLFKKRPEYQLQTENGSSVVKKDQLFWVDPGNPNVQRYLYKMIETLLVNYKIDEIHLDYIRYPIVAEKLNRMLPELTRGEVITEFVKKINTLTSYHNVRLSLATYAIIVWGNEQDVNITGQDVTKLSYYCDGLHLMVYPSHFYPGFAGLENPADHPKEIIKKTMSKLFNLTKGQNDNLDRSPWMQAFDMSVSNFDENYILSSIEASSHYGQGFYFWDASNKYKELLTALSSMNKPQINLKTNDLLLEKSSNEIDKITPFGKNENDPFYPQKQNW